MNNIYNEKDDDIMFKQSQSILMGNSNNQNHKTCLFYWGIIGLISLILLGGIVIIVNELGDDVERDKRLLEEDMGVAHKTLKDNTLIYEELNKAKSVMMERHQKLLKEINSYREEKNDYRDYNAIVERNHKLEDYKNRLNLKLENERKVLKEMQILKEKLKEEIIDLEGLEELSTRAVNSMHSQIYALKKRLNEKNKKSLL